MKTPFFRNILVYILMLRKASQMLQWFANSSTALLAAIIICMYTTSLTITTQNCKFQPFCYYNNMNIYCGSGRHIFLFQI